MFLSPPPLFRGPIATCRFNSGRSKLKTKNLGTKNEMPQFYNGIDF
jgi:hypothetical protein